MSSKTIAIIQARMASSRLPEKVLLDLYGKPTLVHTVERTRRARTIDEVVVATTADISDDPVVILCQDRDFLCYRGSTHDVLDRYYQAARSLEADTIVRITADCPVIDPDVIDKTVNAFWGAPSSEDQSLINGESQRTIQYDFAANRLPPPWGRTFPIGLDTEVCSYAGLELAWKEADLPHQREHVMPFFYEQPDRFRILLVNNDTDHGDLRWTLDTSEDLELLHQIFAHFEGRNDFSWLDVLYLVEQEPRLTQINARIRPKHYQAIDERRNSD